mmetsp:Transcript_48714/g.72324  ORF Transcript_48714/g.72324 Transcript_48714/m.72324 type:complete len:332 (+) Transcript_48714:1432-2427(+)
MVAVHGICEQLRRQVAQGAHLCRETQIFSVTVSVSGVTADGRLHTTARRVRSRAVSGRGGVVQIRQMTPSSSGRRRLCRQRVDTIRLLGDHSINCGGCRMRAATVCLPHFAPGTRRSSAMPTLRHSMWLSDALLVCSKVNDFNLPMSINQNVGRLQVAMHEVFAVEILHSCCHATGELQTQRQRQRKARVAQYTFQTAKTAKFSGDTKALAPVRSGNPRHDTECSDNVGVLQPTEDHSFTHEVIDVLLCVFRGDDGSHRISRVGGLLDNELDRDFVMVLQHRAVHTLLLVGIYAGAKTDVFLRTVDCSLRNDGVLLVSFCATHSVRRIPRN